MLNVSVTVLTHFNHRLNVNKIKSRYYICVGSTSCSCMQSKPMQGRGTQPDGMQLFLPLILAMRNVMISYVKVRNVMVRKL